MVTIARAHTILESHIKFTYSKKYSNKLILCQIRDSRYHRRASIIVGRKSEVSEFTANRIELADRVLETRNQSEPQATNKFTGEPR